MTDEPRVGAIECRNCHMLISESISARVAESVLPACMMPDGADPCEAFTKVMADNDRLCARVVELQALLIRVVNHGDASGDVELIADIKRATPEAGWTDNAGGRGQPDMWIYCWKNGRRTTPCATCDCEHKPAPATESE